MQEGGTPAHLYASSPVVLQNDGKNGKQGKHLCNVHIRFILPVLCRVGKGGLLACRDCESVAEVLMSSKLDLSLLLFSILPKLLLLKVTCGTTLEPFGFEWQNDFAPLASVYLWLRISILGFFLQFLNVLLLSRFLSLGSSLDVFYIVG